MLKRRPEDRITRFIACVRDAHPDMEGLFMQGQCYRFGLILRAAFPGTEIFYSEFEGHVYSRIDGRFYDIRGLHLSVPGDLKLLNHKMDDRPHRWGGRDIRRLRQSRRR